MTLPTTPVTTPSPPPASVLALLTAIELLVGNEPGTASVPPLIVIAPLNVSVLVKLTVPPPVTMTGVSSPIHRPQYAAA